MSLTNTQYATIMREYDEIKNNNRHLLETRYNEVITLCPKIEQIDSEIIDLSMKSAYSRIGQASSTTTTDKLENQLLNLKNEKESLLLSIGKPANYLDEIFTCATCHDTGFINGVRCSCFNKKAIDLVYSDSNLKNITQDENFDTFSLKWYNNSDIDSATGLTPYNNMQKVLGLCRNFVDNFDKDFSNLLFFGHTGVGKTFLTNCIAKSLLDTSHSVIYLTAIELFELFSNNDFGKSREDETSFDATNLLECDLLIIDDLGTEVSNTYTNSKLFYIINERLLRKKSIVISTNLALTQIEDRYSQRIFSRIVSGYMILHIFGEDIRLLKRIDN